MKDINQDLKIVEKYHISPHQKHPYYKEINTEKPLPIYLNQIIEKDMFNFFKNLNGKKAFSSFLQVGMGTKFYSNDLLLKNENVLNEDTEKIINESKKINEVTK